MMNLEICKEQDIPVCIKIINLVHHYTLQKHTIIVCLFFDDDTVNKICGDSTTSNLSPDTVNIVPPLYGEQDTLTHTT